MVYLLLHRKNHQCTLTQETCRDLVLIISPARDTPFDPRIQGYRLQYLQLRSAPRGPPGRSGHEEGRCWRGRPVATTAATGRHAAGLGRRSAAGPAARSESGAYEIRLRAVLDAQVKAIGKVERAGWTEDSVGLGEPDQRGRTTGCFHELYAAFWVSRDIRLNASKDKPSAGSEYEIVAIPSCKTINLPYISDVGLEPRLR